MKRKQHDTGQTKAHWSGLNTTQGCPSPPAQPPPRLPPDSARCTTDHCGSRQIPGPSGNETWQARAVPGEGDRATASAWPPGSLHGHTHRAPASDGLWGEEQMKVGAGGSGLEGQGTLYRSSDSREFQGRDGESVRPHAALHHQGSGTETPQGNGGPSLLRPKPPHSPAEPPSFDNGDATHSAPFRPEDNTTHGCKREEEEEEGEEGEDEGSERESESCTWKPEGEELRHSGKPGPGGRNNNRRQRQKSGTKDVSPGEKEEEGRGGEQGRREARPASASAKHRHGRGDRKRQHQDSRGRPRAVAHRPVGEAVRLGLSYVKILTDVILFVTHKCGEYVEAGGGLVYSCCRLRRGDWESLRARLRTSSCRLLARSRLGSEKLRHAGLFSLRNSLRLLKLLLALVFLVLMFLLGLARLCCRYGQMGVSRWLGAEGLGGFPSASFLRRARAAVGSSRTWECARRLWGKAKGKFWRPDKWRTAPGQQQASHFPPTPSAPFPSPAAGREQPQQEVQRLLTMAHVPEEELDPFKVLGLEATATDSELKKAYRQLAILVHPDKNPHPRSEEAFKVVRAAWDIVSNPERRKEYEIKRATESELHRSMNEFLSRLQDDLKEAMNSMMCSKCEGKHKKFEMDRDPQCARYCAECNKRHSVEEGDFWAESSLLGLKITYFAMMDGKVYDITEWAGCQRVGISPDIHHVPYHISFATRNAGGGARHRASADTGPASPPDLQEFFTRIFTPNGGFPGPSAPPAPGSKPCPEASQRADSKPKRRKKVRRTFPR